jgi:D-amino peptidase
MISAAKGYEGWKRYAGFVALVGLGVGPATAGAQVRPAQPAPAPAQAVTPPDTTPPESASGVYGSARARELLTRLMDRRGFTVYIIGDMEGLGGVVRNATEMRPSSRGGNDIEHDLFRLQLTNEVNAVIAGARAAGATQFVVNDGHGGTLFANVLPELLDTAAILIRGYPKPIVMQSGINSEVDMMAAVGMHANAGTRGVIAHSFAFDTMTINGTALNETGIAAFIGGEMGVPMGLAAGDDVFGAETRVMVPGIEIVTTKLAYGGSAALVYPPARVLADLRAAAARAVRNVRSGAMRPLRFERPYRVRLCMRRSYQDIVLRQVARLPGVTREGDSRCYTYTTESSEAVGDLFNAIEWIVLKP